MVRILLALLVVTACGRTAPDDTDSWSPSDPPEDTGPTSETVRIRVVSWNIQSVGSPGTSQYEAARDVLRRLDADVIGLNEVDDESDGNNLRSLAVELDYLPVVPTWNPFGSLRNAALTRLPIIASATPTSADLSGDSTADDQTRLPIRLELDVPGAADDLVVVVQHWKSGYDTDDAFRRLIDSHRVTQSASGVGDRPTLVMGDVNAEPDDTASPSRFTALPSGLPSSYDLGQDLYALLVTEGLANDPFAPLEAEAFELLTLRQADGDYATRWVSGRRIDFMFASAGIPSERDSEIYDASDEGMAAALPKSGEPLEENATARASDHFPLVLDLYFPRE